MGVPQTAPPSPTQARGDVWLNEAQVEFLFHSSGGEEGVGGTGKKQACSSRLWLQEGEAGRLRWQGWGEDCSEKYYDCLAGPAMGQGAQLRLQGMQGWQQGRGQGEQHRSTDAAAAAPLAAMDITGPYC